MTDELKPPVAIRITRPYATEAEYLEREFDTLTHTSVVLLGAQSRPQGVVLRFEIVLKTGESLLRGEGRVVGYKEKAYAGEPGLTLRFTRLDSRSKTLVDRASSLREARVRASTSLMAMPAVVVPKANAAASPAPSPAPSVAALDSAPRIATPPPSRPSASPSPRPSPRPSPPPPSRRGPPPLPEWARSAPPPPPLPSPIPASMIDIESTQVDAHFDHLPPPPPPPPPPAPVTAERPYEKRSSTPPPLPTGSPTRGIRPTPARPPPLPKSIPPTASSPPPPRATAPEPAREAWTEPRPRTEPRAQVRREPRREATDVLSAPADRNALLARLRSRAQSLPPARIDEILAHKRA